MQPAQHRPDLHREARVQPIPGILVGGQRSHRRRIAMDIARQFFGHFASKEGARRSAVAALRAVRLDYLAKGNLLGLFYTPYCWADLRMI
jgi:hypothetical protein